MESPEEVTRIFGLQLSHLLKRGPLSQQELASKVGLSQTTISSFARGIKRPYLDQVLLLANAFRVNLGYFVENFPPDYREDEEDESYIDPRLNSVKALEIMQRRLKRLAMRSYFETEHSEFFLAEIRSIDKIADEEYALHVQFGLELPPILLKGRDAVALETEHHIYVTRRKAIVDGYNKYKEVK